MIFIGLGANLPSSDLGSPQAACEAALAALEEAEIHILRRSRWYRSAPLPASDQPWFINGVAHVETALAPAPLLAEMHRIEAALGRERGARNAPRVIDLDLLAHGDRVIDGGNGGEYGEKGLILPHPRLHERAFVLFPLQEVACAWRHPVFGATPAELLDRLPPGQSCDPLNGGP